MAYLAASQLVLTGLFYFIYFRDTRIGLLVSALCFCLIASVLAPNISELSYLVGRIGAATPAVLWLFAHALFVDDKKISPLEWFLLFSYQLARGVATFPSLADNASESLTLSVLSALGLIVAFGLAMQVIIMATKDFSNDLLEERRRIRGPFAAGLGIVMAVLVAAVLSPLLPTGTFTTWFGFGALFTGFFLIFLFFLIFNLLTFRLSPDSQQLLDSAVSEPEDKLNSYLQLADTDLELVRELDRKMLQERIFTGPELTIGELSKLLAVQEYKLRIIINRELGYKNFNQFLNHYRINEACILLEKKSKHRNISIVAQEVGYVSLSAFNQAFKKIKGVTPSVYKTKHVSRAQG